MKLNKIFALALAALTLTACSDDDDTVTWNTNTDVTVTLDQQEVTVKENAGLFFLPINVQGERNGCIKVTVAVKQEAAYPDTQAAQDPLNFFITTKTVIIDPAADSYNLEITAVDDPLPGDDLSFTVYIESVEYAQMGGANQTIVRINDKGASPQFDALPTTWRCSAWINEEADMYSWNSTMTQNGEPEEQLNKNIWYNTTFDNFMGGNLTGSDVLQVIYRYDPKLAYGDFYIPYGSKVTEANFTGLGPCDVVVGASNGGLPNAGGIAIIWNNDFTGFSMGSEQFSLVVVQKGGNVAGYWAFIGGFTAEFPDEE